MAAAFSFSAIDWSADFQNYILPYQEHGYLHLISFSFWMFCHFASGYYYKNYTNCIQNGVEAAMLADKTKSKQHSEAYHYRKVRLDLMIKTVALIHALVSSAGALVAFSDPRVGINFNDVYTAEPFFSNVCLISSGYFMYDFVMAIIERDLAFFLHGALSYSVFGHSTYPFMNHVGAMFLMYEISTVFLNIRFLMITTGSTKHKLFNPVQWLFFASFMIVRMVWGSYYSFGHMQPFLYNLLSHQDPAGPPHSHIAAAMFMISNAGLQSLNVIWTVMMFKTIKKQFWGDKDAVKGKVE